LSREIVKPAGDEVAPLALESEGKLRVLDAEENETIGYGKSAGVVIIEDEHNLSEGGMLHDERCRKGARLHERDETTPLTVLIQAPPPVRREPEKQRR
jgi:hypothetical protein